LNETISDLPKFYGTAKDTVTAENLINRIDAWTQEMAFHYFTMALHSNAESWIKLVCETNDDFLPTWDFFKSRFGKKMVVSKVGTVLDNLKMDPNDQVSDFAAKMNNNLSQLRELIPWGQIVNIPEAPANRTNAICISTMQYVQKTIEAGLEQAQYQKLSYTLFPNDVLQRIKQKIDHLAQDNEWLYFICHKSN